MKTQPCPTSDNPTVSHNETVSLDEGAAGYRDITIGLVRQVDVTYRAWMKRRGFTSIGFKNTAQRAKAAG